MEILGKASISTEPTDNDDVTSKGYVDGKIADIHFPIVNTNVLLIGMSGTKGVDYETDGVNDSAIIQQAINAASDGYSLIFRSGTYNIKNSLSVNKSLSFLGSGEDCVLNTYEFDPDVSHGSIYVTAAAFSMNGFTVNVFGSNTTAKRNNIAVENVAANLEITNCRFRVDDNFTGRGLVFQIIRHDTMGETPTDNSAGRKLAVSGCSFYANLTKPLINSDTDVNANLIIIQYGGLANATTYMYMGVASYVKECTFDVLEGLVCPLLTQCSYMSFESNQVNYNGDGYVISFGNPSTYCECKLCNINVTKSTRAGIGIIATGGAAARRNNLFRNRFIFDFADSTLFVNRALVYINGSHTTVLENYIEVWDNQNPGRVHSVTDTAGTNNNHRIINNLFQIHTNRPDLWGFHGCDNNPWTNINSTIMTHNRLYTENTDATGTVTPTKAAIFIDNGNYRIDDVGCIDLWNPAVPTDPNNASNPMWKFGTNGMIGFNTRV